MMAAALYCSPSLHDEGHPLECLEPLAGLLRKVGRVVFHVLFVQLLLLRSPPSPRRPVRSSLSVAGHSIKRYSTTIIEAEVSACLTVTTDLWSSTGKRSKSRSVES